MYSKYSKARFFKSLIISLKPRFFLLICLLASSLTLSGCIYRMDIQQGNAISPEITSCIKKGMTKDQVQEMLGTPALDSCVETNRWIYFYSLKSGKTGKTTTYRFTVYFKNDRVVNFE